MFWRGSFFLNARERRIPSTTIPEMIRNQRSNQFGKGNPRSAISVFKNVKIMTSKYVFMGTL